MHCNKANLWFIFNEHFHTIINKLTNKTEIVSIIRLYLCCSDMDVEFTTPPSYLCCSDMDIEFTTPPSYWFHVDSFTHNGVHSCLFTVRR